MIQKRRLRRTSHLVGALLLLCTSASAQFNPLFPNDLIEQPDPILNHLRRLPREQLTTTSLARAKSAILSGDVPEGLEALQSLLDESSDFFQIEGIMLGGSIREEAERLIARHQAEYERLYGAEAIQLYTSALETQDIEKFAELIRRFRLTAAGLKASQAWAVLGIDRGDLEGGTRQLASTARLAMMFNSPPQKVQAILQQIAEQLALTGRTESLEALLVEFAEQLANGGEPVVAKVTEQLIAPAGEARLFEWRTPHGGVSQTGNTSFAPAMLADAWEQPLIDQYDFFLGDLKKEQARMHDALAVARSTESKVWSRRDRSGLPAGRPLIVGNRVIVQGYGSTKSYDLKTGEIDGVGVHIDQSFEYLHEFTAATALLNDPFRDEMRELFFSLRGWRDLSSAALSSDGEFVYAVSDCQLAGSVDPDHLSRSTQRHELLPQPFNQLRAYELKSGLRNRWSVGTVDENAVLPFDQNTSLNREIYFYGAPLPLDRQLYVIGEERGQILLYELDRATGGIQWSIGLLNPDQEITLDSDRRLSGIAPSYVDGLLVCPTGEGVITAVNPLTRKVVWTHQYGESRQISINRRLFQRGMRTRGQTVRQSMETLLADDRWFDAKVISAGEYMIHSPPDSDELVCLHARDGSPVWKDSAFRLRSLYLGGVYNQSLILVGRSEVSAIQLIDGKKLWSCPIPRPSGRGLAMGNQFVQPLMTGEIAFVDLRTGQQTVRTPVPGGRVLGNLSAAHGRLVAQSGTQIIAFQTVPEFSEHLAALEQQAQRDELQGELLLQKGDLATGQQLLESVPREQLTQRGKSVLAWAKLDGLKHDFNRYQPEAEQIEQLLTTAEQRFHYLQSTAIGLQASGKLDEAFHNYLRLFENLTGRTTLRDFEGLQEINDQRWALAQLLQIYDGLPADSRQKVVATLNRWIAEVKSDQALVHFLKSFPLRSLDTAILLKRLQQVEKIANNAGGLVSIYEALVELDDAKISAFANLQQAHLALHFKDGPTAQAYLARLQGEQVLPWGSDQPAQKIASSILKDMQWSEEFNSIPVWPTNVVESDLNVPFAKSSRNQIPLLGPPSVPLQGWTFFLNPMGSHIDIYDEHGRRQCQLTTGIVSPRFPIGSTLARYVSVRGHLAIIVLADRFLLIDFQQRKELPRVVMSQSLITEDQNPYGTDSFVSADQRPEPGFRTFRSFTPIGTPAGNVGTLGASSLCYGLGTELVAVDPNSAEVLWKRYDLELGSEIFSDDEFVLTMAPGTRELKLYSVIDGSFQGIRKVPATAIDSILDRENGDWGRLLPLVERTGDALRFSMYDPVSEEVLWQKQLSAGTAWTTVDGENLAFLTPEHELSLLQGRTGAIILSKQIPASEKVKSLTVLSRSNQWIVLPGTGPPLQYDFSYPSLITRSIEKTVHGTIVAIACSTGQIQWSLEVDDQKTTTQSPTAWPILFFGNSSGRNVKGLIVNRLDGKVAVEEEWPYDRTWIHWRATIQPLKILIGYGRKTVTLDCHEPLAIGEQKEKNEVPQSRNSPDF